jgi:hypothetical protein
LQFEHQSQFRSQDDRLEPDFTSATRSGTLNFDSWRHPAGFDARDIENLVDDRSMRRPFDSTRPVTLDRRFNRSATPCSSIDV